jgi:hypothetical protein
MFRSVIYCAALSGVLASTPVRAADAKQPKGKPPQLVTAVVLFDRGIDPVLVTVQSEQVVAVEGNDKEVVAAKAKTIYYAQAFPFKQVQVSETAGKPLSPKKAQEMLARPGPVVLSEGEPVDPFT